MIVAYLKVISQHSRLEGLMNARKYVRRFQNTNSCVNLLDKHYRDSAIFTCTSIDMNLHQELNELLWISKCFKQIHVYA
jgi:hypothetical protein